MEEQEQEAVTGAGAFAVPQLAPAGAAALQARDQANMAIGGAPPLALINPNRLASAVGWAAPRIGESFMRSTATAIDAITNAIESIPYIGRTHIVGTNPRDVAQAFRSNAPHPPEPQGFREQLGDTMARVVGGAPVAIGTWFTGPIGAGAMGYQMVREWAQELGRQPTRREIMMGVAIEAVARRYLGNSLGRDWGRITHGLNFAGTSAVQHLAHRANMGIPVHSSQAGTEAAIAFVLGVLGPNISPQTRALVQAAREAAARGEGAGALRHLNPILMRNAEAIANAAFSKTATITPAGGPRGPPAPPRAPRPRPPKLEPPSPEFETDGGAVWRMRRGGGTSRVLQRDEGEIRSNSDRTVYLTMQEAQRLQSFIARPDNNVGPIRIHLPSAGRGGNILRTFAWMKDRNTWRGSPEGRVPFLTDPAPGLIPLELWNNGRFQWGSPIRNVRTGAEALQQRQAVRMARGVRSMRQGTPGELVPEGQQPRAQPAAQPQPQPQPAAGLPPETPLPPTGREMVPRRSPPPITDAQLSAMGGGTGGPPPPPPGTGRGVPMRDPQGGGFRMVGPPPFVNRFHKLPPVLSNLWRIATERAEATAGTTITMRERADALVRDFTDRMELAFKGVHDRARIAFIDAWMNGAPERIPPQYRQWFQEADRLFRQIEMAEKLTGQINYTVREHYFHLQFKPKDWKRAARYGQQSATRAPLFGKHKVFNDAMEGRRAGFELVSTNPGTLVAMRLEAGHRALERVLMMQHMQEVGLAIRWSDYRKLYAKIPKRPHMEGARPKGPYVEWEPMRIGGYDYLVHPDAGRIIRWGLNIEQRTFMQLLGLPRLGKADRAWGAFAEAWRNTRNTVIPAKLALSAFHAKHMLNIRISNPLGNMLNAAIRRDQSPAQLFKQWRDMSERGSTAYGQRMGEVFQMPVSDKPIGQRTAKDMGPIEEIELNLMIAAGHNPHQPSIYQLNAERGLRRLLNDDIPTLMQQIPKGRMEQLARARGVSVAAAKASMFEIAQAVEHMQKPLFGVWIPAIKNAAFLNEAKMLITRRPDLLRNTPKSNAELRHELRQIDKSIDNRFGMMQYDKVFWPMLTKRFFMATMLSVGWNYGFFREFIAGPFRDIERGTRNVASRMTDKNLRRPQGESSIEHAIGTRTTYVAMYTLSSLIIAGLMTYIFTGRPPQEPKDLIYPKLPDGSRVNTQMFTREFGAMYYHWRNEGVSEGTLHLLLNKANSLVTAMWEMIRGTDYYGRQIYNPDASTAVQWGQRLWHATVASALPISAQGLYSGQIIGPLQAALGGAGYNPAPRYVEQGGIAAQIMHAYRASHPQGVIPWSEIERTDTIRQARRYFNEWRRTGNEEFRREYWRLIQKYARENPTRTGPRGQYLTQMIRGWYAPEGAIQLRSLDPATQRRLFNLMTPEEQRLYGPYMRHGPSRHRGGTR